MARNRDLDAPEGLSDLGRKAHAAIAAFVRKTLRRKKLPIYTGGSRAFYSPAEWRARKEEYGGDSELVVVYDGGYVGWFFEYAKEQYDLVEAMQEELRKVGCSAQPMTHWYAGIYAYEPTVLVGSGPCCPECDVVAKEDSP